MKRKRTYADRREYIKAAVVKRRKKIKTMAVEYLGGKCMSCSYCRSIDALDFHHLDTNSKDFGVSKDGLTRSWERVRKELDKCVLLCANCHREIHAGVIAAPRRNARVETG